MYNDEYGILINAAGTRDLDTFINALLSILPPIYQKDKESNIYKLYKALAEELYHLDLYIDRIKNDNFLSVLKEDVIVKSKSDVDYIRDEGVYELIDIRAYPKEKLSIVECYLNIGKNEIILPSFPYNENTFIIEMYINDSTKIKKYYEYKYNKINNSLIIYQAEEGKHVISYTDDGKCIQFNEHIYIDNGFFDIGYDEGGFGEFGFGE